MFAVLTRVVMIVGRARMGVRMLVLMAVRMAVSGTAM